MASRGFSVFSLSNAVRDEADRLGRDHSRDTLIEIGVQLRAAGGSGALAQKVLPRLQGRSTVDSIRHPGEVAVLRTLPRFILLGVDAPQELRFERSLQRGRTGDGTTLQEFADKESRENSTTESGQQLRATMLLADVVISNHGTLADLHRTIQPALEQVGVLIDSEG